MASKHSEDVSKATGANALSQEAIHNVRLNSNEQKVLKEIKSVISDQQMTHRKLGFASPWIVSRAAGAEIMSNWDGTYEEVKDKNIPGNANVIPSHIIFKVNTEEKGKLRLKAGLCPHSNREKFKYDVRKDSSTAQVDVIRLLLSVTVALKFRLGCADIKGA